MSRSNRQRITEAFREINGSGDGGPLLVTQTVSRIAAMALRGLVARAFLKETSGLLLVGRGVRIRNPHRISFGSGVVIEDYAEVQGRSQEGIRFGDGVTVGSFAMIRPSGYYGRKAGIGLSIGAGSNIGPLCYIGCSGGISIGENVMIGPGVNLFAENHVFARTDMTMKDQGVTWAKIVVEDDCWLASGSTVVAGVTIGRGSIVAAGAVVTRDVPAFSIAAGVPAEIVGSREQSVAQSQS